MAKVFSQDEVSQHNKKEDLWIIVEGGVYDLTSFQSEHPGGGKILTKVAGQDASEQFAKFHNEAILKRVGGPLKIGQVKKAEAASPKEQTGQNESKTGANNTGATSEMPRPPRPSSQARAGTGPKMKALDNAPLGKSDEKGSYVDLTPYAEIPAATRPSPYYNESHRRFRDGVRAWHDEHLEGRAGEYDEAGEAPRHIYDSAVKTNLMLASVALGLKDDPEWNEKEVFGVKIKVSKRAGFNRSLTSTGFRWTS